MSILITGAGPTGLTLAIELARRGLQPTIIDKKEGLSEKSKAIVLHSRTLELLEKTGVADELLDHGLHCNGAVFHEDQQELFRLQLQRLRGKTHYDYFLNVSQSDTEAILADRLEQLDIRIRWNTELTNLEYHADRVTTTLRVGDEEDLICDFDYVVGCDGGRSTVREQVNIDFPGDRRDEVFFTADVDIDWERPNDMFYFWLVDNGAVFTAPLPGPKNYRIILQQPKDEADTRGESYYENRDNLDIDELQRMLDRLLPGEMRVSNPRWIGTFDIPHHVATTYRRGRVLIAGDACHLHPPLGGQGMNASIQDACNLGWKLALVARGIAPEDLLDTYEQERLPVGRKLVESTMRGFELMIDPGRMVSNLRNRLLQFATGFSPVAQLAASHMSMQDINYAESDLNETDTEDGLLNLRQEGPEPGFRAPEALVYTDQKSSGRLLPHFDPLGFTLLFLPGKLSDADTFFTGPTYREYQRVAEQLAAELPFPLTAYLVSRRRPDTTFVPPLAYLHDTYREVEEAYRLRSHPLAVLVRPDGHIGLVIRQIDLPTLQTYFSHHLLRTPLPAA